MALMQPLIPFVILSDFPGEPTGVSRIATELAGRLEGAKDQLGIDVLQVGYLGLSEMPRGGLPIRTPYPWKVWGHNDQASWGAVALRAAVNTTWGGPGQRPPRGIVLAVQDADRSFHLLEIVKELGWELWGYLSLDGHNPRGIIGGPAGETIRQCEQIAAYGSYGAEIFGRLRNETVVGIPHGIDPTVFSPTFTKAEQENAQQTLAVLPGQRVIGCVATNQPRKDLHLFLAVLARLRTAYELNLRGWLHVDRDIASAWSIPELANVYNLDWRALTVTHHMSDRELAACYAGCVVTLAVGRGEGFGYPIVESLACGTPCLHVDYAEGARHLPEQRWRLVPMLTAWDVVGPYAIFRPVLQVRDVATAIDLELTIAQQRPDAAAYRHGLAGTMEKYHTNLVWHTQMQPWVEQGLRRFQERQING